MRDSPQCGCKNLRPGNEAVLYCKAASLTDLKYSSKTNVESSLGSELAYTGDFSRVQGANNGTSSRLWSA